MDTKSPEATNPFLQLPDIVVQQIMDRTASHRDLASASQVDSRFHTLAQNVPVEGSNVTLGQLNHAMQGYELTGFHGATVGSGPSLYNGLDASRSGSVNATKQLGDGFYTVPPADRHDKDDREAARKTALSWAPGTKSDPSAVYPVLTKGLDEEHIHRQKSPSKTDVGRHPDFDAIHAPLDGGGKQLMIKPHVYDEDWRDGARSKLDKYYDSYQYEKKLKDDSEFPVDVDEDMSEYKKAEFDERMKGMGVQVVPPTNPQGTLGPDFLNAIERRINQ